MKTKKALLSLIIFIALALIAIIFVIFPLLRSIQRESANLISQKNTLAGLDVKIKNLQKFQLTCQNYQTNLDKIDELFINSTEPVNFIEFLETEANNQQLLIEIAPLPPQKMKGDLWPSVNFQLGLSGNFDDFTRFLEKLESSIYLLEILNLSVRELTEEASGEVDVSLLIKVFARE